MKLKAEKITNYVMLCQLLTYVIQKVFRINRRFQKLAYYTGYSFINLINGECIYFQDNFFMYRN